jgi:hypothetical protein
VHPKDPFSHSGVFIGLEQSETVERKESKDVLSFEQTKNRQRIRGFRTSQKRCD